MIGNYDISYGYWGPALVRNFMANPDTQVLSVCDRAQARLEKVAATYLNVKTTECLEHLIGDPSIDAVDIAMPVAAYFELAMAELIAG